MFSPTPNFTRSDGPQWRAMFRNAVDRTVAFATLESYQLPGSPAAADAPEPHPHRQAAVRAVRERRPGMPAAREQHCASPLPRRPRRRTQDSTLR